jgi:hypothetical protein
MNPEQALLTCIPDRPGVVFASTTPFSSPQFSPRQQSDLPADCCANKKKCETLFSQWRQYFLTDNIQVDIFSVPAAINPCSAADLTITCRLILTGNGGHLLSP